uniref:SHC adaptor protein 4 n=1 Tax=Nothoprocta perdicaria TaxID=30464 RepID=A0A8C6ZT95_NOTPE
MQSISFASGGDPRVYFIKERCLFAACHILECPDGMAQEVINTIGQAFELRFKQYLKNPSSLVTSTESEAVTDRSSGNAQEREDHEYYNEIPGKEPPTGGVLDMRVKVQTSQRTNCPMQCKKQYCLVSTSSSGITIHCSGAERAPKTRKDAPLLKPASRTDLFDDPCYINTQTLQPAACAARGSAAAQAHGSPLHHAKLPEAVQQSAASNTAGLPIMPQIKQQLKNEDCYHGKLNRKAAESLLVNDGDFLVRESTTSPGQYVLSGLQGGQAKHLLLVDPEGKVRTKDRIFDSVGHLIQYHMENNLPIISSGSEVSLKQPVRKDSNVGQMHYHK